MAGLMGINTDAVSQIPPDLLQSIVGLPQDTLKSLVVMPQDMGGIISGSASGQALSGGSGGQTAPVIPMGVDPSAAAQLAAAPTAPQAPQAAPPAAIAQQATPAAMAPPQAAPSALVPQIPMHDPSLQQGPPPVVPQLPQGGAPPMAGPTGLQQPLTGVAGVLDRMFLGGAIGSERQAQNDYLSQQYRMRQLGVFAGQLPPSDRAAFMADPQGYLTSRNANVPVKAGDTELGPAAVASGGGPVTAPVMGIDNASGVGFTQRPGSITPTGQFGGDIKPADGLIVSSRTGVQGAYSVPQKLAPGESPSSFTPAVSGASFSGPGPIVPQVGQGALAPGGAAPPSPGTSVVFHPPVQSPVTSAFGRPRPYGGHTGVDYAIPTGTPVAAAADGTVVSAGPKGGYGNAVVIRHADGSTSIYGHLSALNVQPGQPVKGGQVIAASGATGTATGPNLHFGIYDAHGHALNPSVVLGGAHAAPAPARQTAQASGAAAAGWTVGQPAGAGYHIVDGSQIPGGKPGERYSISPTGEPTAISGDGTFNPGTMAARGQATMGSEDYKNASTSASAVNGLISAIKSVPKGTALSWATIDTAMRAFNPTMGVRASNISTFSDELGLQSHVEAELEKFQKQGFVPPDVAKQLLNAAYSYAESHMNILGQRHAADVKYATGHGFQEGDLGESLPALAPLPLPDRPAPGELVPNRTYETPKGVLRWDGSRFQPVKP